MQLPFLKQNKLPKPSSAEKSIGLSGDEQMDEHCISELWDAIRDDDSMGFRKALEALVMNSFDSGRD
jgi:hypothetical protein